ncbi:MAG: hypothetical protein C0594_01545, partial [Marinilabiliales bacterium]
FTLEEFKLTHGTNLYETSSNTNLKQTIEDCIKSRSSAIYTSYSTTKNNQQIWLQTTLTPIVSTEGKLIKLVAIDSDVTKIKEAEEEILMQKQEITDSIQYASRIQSALLPPADFLCKYMDSYFILNKPRDIVSGDFYWISENSTHIYIAAADCTGHGVPGAFMSLLGITFLNEIMAIHSEISTGNILDQLKNSVIKSLHQSGTDDGDIKRDIVRDGMDMAMIALNKSNNQLQYSGANNPLYLVREYNGSIPSIDKEPSVIINNTQLFEFKADKMPIGLHYNDTEDTFTTNQIELSAGDSLYMFSDGYVDQFGGELGKKFKSKAFKELMVTNNHLSMSEIKQLLDDTHNKWKGDKEQIDDILVLGIRI